MEKRNEFPLSAGFLLPNGDYYPNMGRGHENTAYMVLRDVFKMNILNIEDPEDVLQTKYSAILIRYRWGEKLIYLPRIAPKTVGGCIYFKRAIDFYKKEGFQIINIYKINLDKEEFLIKEFIGEEYEQIKIFTVCNNYTQTIIKCTNGKYMYNPERVGD